MDVFLLQMCDVSPKLMDRAVGMLSGRRVHGDYVGGWTRFHRRCFGYKFSLLMVVLCSKRSELIGAIVHIAKDEMALAG